MHDTWLDITNLPAEGQEFTFDDQGLWTGPWRELGMSGKGPVEADPVRATIRIFPGDDGWMATGTLSGTVRMVCDRCASPAEYRLEHDIEAFAPRPGRGSDEDEGESVRIRVSGAKVELDVGALLWEEFVLALPVKPLCRTECAGLCPHCGADRNEAPCDCEDDQGDPRMAVFRGLKVDKN